MQKIIVASSIFLYCLSFFILYRTFFMDQHYDANHTMIKETQISPELGSVLSSFATQQANNKETIEKLQKTIRNLEQKLSDNVIFQPEYKPKVNINTLNKEELPSSDMTAPNKHILMLGSGFFKSGYEFNKQLIRQKVKKILPIIMSSLKQQVIIEGHTDNSPIRASSKQRRFHNNRELSILRAESVKKALTQLNVPGDRITVIGYGDSKPIAPNNTRSNKAKNRRVEIKIMPSYEHTIQKNSSTVTRLNRSLSLESNVNIILNQTKSL